MAWCRRRGAISGAGSTRCSVASTRSRWACDQAEKSIVAIAAVTLEVPQDAVLQHLHLLLRILQGGLAILEKLGAALVGGERALERQLAFLHAGDDFLELRQRGLQGLRW